MIFASSGDLQERAHQRVSHWCGSSRRRGPNEPSAPGVEAELVPLALALLVLKVVDGVSRRVGRQVTDKVVVRRRLRRLFDLDLLVVVRELEDNVLELYTDKSVSDRNPIMSSLRSQERTLAKLQSLVGLEAGLVDADTGRLCIAEKRSARSPIQDHLLVRDVPSHTHEPAGHASPGQHSFTAHTPTSSSPQRAARCRSTAAARSPGSLPVRQSTLAVLRLPTQSRERSIGPVLKRGLMTLAKSVNEAMGGEEAASVFARGSLVSKDGPGSPSRSLAVLEEAGGGLGRPTEEETVVCPQQRPR